MMPDTIAHTLHPRAAKRLWICSDLQQQLPANATRCLRTALDDILSLGLPLDGVCYLGDATEGQDLDHIAQMTRMQAEQFGRLNAPIYYAVGNHDLDCNLRTGPAVPLQVPFYDAVRALPAWHTTGDFSQPWFTVDLGDFALVLLSDHGDPHGQWFTTHGKVHRNADAYPYDAAYYQALSDEIGAIGKPVFTLSHYAFPGGNRPSDLLARMLPLPGNVRMHFYGHAHIGDAFWAGKDLYRKIACVDDQPIVQINVSSLENVRGNSIRSALFEWYGDASVAVFFRDHELRRWDEVYVAGP